MARPSTLYERRLAYLSATRSTAVSRLPSTMQCSIGPQNALRGRNPDSKWVHWLTSSRRNSPRARRGTLSSSASPASRSRASSTISDNRHIRSRSSATSYFALLSANEDACHDCKPYSNPKQNSHGLGLTAQDMDSSWLSWFNDRWDQRQLPDMPDKMVQDQSFLNHNKTSSPSEIQPPHMQQFCLPQDSAVSGTAATSTVPSSVGTTSPWLSPSNVPLELDIDSLDNLNELLSNTTSTIPYDPTISQANGAAGTYATAGGLDGDFTWLDEQQAFPLNIKDEPGRATSPSSVKRGCEDFLGDFLDDGAQTHVDDITNKKQKTFHSWANHLETSSPFPCATFQATQ